MTEIKGVKLASRALTTNEIKADYAVEILKQNKREGRAFAFLPFKVKEWAKKNPQELLVYSRKMGNDKLEWLRRGQCDYPLHEDSIYGLPDDYELQSTVKDGEWIEFDIDEKGFFQLKKEDKNLKDSKDSNNEVFYGGYGEEFNKFHWSDWGYFLTRCADSDVNYSAFGGWKYENCDTWFMCPMMSEKGISYHNTDRKKDYIGAVPVKIRFWREKNAKKMTETEKDKIENFLINNSRYKIPYRDLGSNIRFWIQSWPNIKKCHKWDGSVWISCKNTDFFEQIDPQSIFCLFDDYEKNGGKE